MSGTTRKGSGKGSGLVLDFFVVLLCLSGVAVSLFLFQRDLFRTLRSSAIQPAGTVTVRYNTVQRRLADRVVWDRLYTESPVYSGDLIRIARLSGAVLNIENHQIELGENSLIRIQKNDGLPQIDFYLGDIRITSERGTGGIVLMVAGRQIEASGGASISASAGNEGMVLRVNEGTVQVIQDGQIQTVPAGTVISQDAGGRERRDPMVVVTQPRPNARYLKTGTQPYAVNFVWNRINLNSGERLRLEIAEDRNFKTIVRNFENLDSIATAYMDAGVWHWRLSYNSAILKNGRITVTEADEPVLIDLAVENEIYFKKLKPQVNFRWTEIDDVAYYYLQVSRSPDFIDPQIFVQVQGTSFISPELDSGTWYWRVRPVYPPVYEGSTVFSDAAVFHINQRSELEPPALNFPAPDSMVNAGADGTDLSFSWAGSREAVSYTIQISANPDLRNPLINETVRDNFYVYGKDGNILAPGLYYWSVFYTDDEGNRSPVSDPRPFMVMEREVSQRLISPPDGYSIEESRLPDTSFTWRSNLLYERRFQVSALPDFSQMEIDVPVTGDSYQGVSVPPGDWYWRISAKYDDQSRAYSTPARRFSLLLSPPPSSLAYVEPESESEPESEPETELEPLPASTVQPEQSAVQPPPPRLTLVSPAQGTVIPGLDALRRPVVFRWDTSADVGRSRFILSRNSNPSALPEIAINNPGRTVTVNRLGEGLWYWTVEAQTRDGRPIIAGNPRQLRVQQIPLLPPPGNLLPVSGHLVGAEELRQSREIVFNWSAVAGANAYILTINRETSSGRRRIFQSEPMRGLSYTFDNLELLNHSSTYIWQVEALLLNSGGVIERRGTRGESTLILDVPLPGRVRTGDTGVLYGF